MIQGPILFKTVDREGNWYDIVDVLKMVPENDWTWTIFYWYGAADDKFPDLDKGQTLSCDWKELHHLTTLISQTHDCTIVATDGPPKISRDDALRRNFEGCKVAIVENDCTFWEIFSDSSILLEFNPSPTNKPFRFDK